MSVSVSRASWDTEFQKWGGSVGDSHPTETKSWHHAFVMVPIWNTRRGTATVMGPRLAAGHQLLSLSISGDGLDWHSVVMFQSDYCDMALLPRALSSSAEDIARKVGEGGSF